MHSGNLAPGEQFVQCPYNVSHMIINRKQITHLDKCRKQYEKEERAQGRKPEIVACRFNFSHKICKPEQLFHEQHCQDQFTVIHAMTVSVDTESQVSPMHATRPISPTGMAFADDEDDWDACPSSGGYDPSIKLKEGNIIYMKPGMTKSERKATKLENRKKWMEMQEKAAAAAPQSFDWDEDA